MKLASLGIRPKGSGALIFVLVDPDRMPMQAHATQIARLETCGVDAILVGSSVMLTEAFDAYVASIQRHTTLPIIGFPGSTHQLSRRLDAVLYLSVISSRNPDFLFGKHLEAAPIIRSMEIDPWSTGYMLVESGNLTTAQYIVQSLPIPRAKPDVAVATALAAQYMGMSLIYLDGGSGAQQAVPVEMIAAVSSVLDIPVMVGGGIRTGEQARQAAEAGASIVVVGTALEQDPSILSELVQGAHLA